MTAIQCAGRMGVEADHFGHLLCVATCLAHPPQEPATAQAGSL